MKKFLIIVFIFLGVLLISHASYLVLKPLLTPSFSFNPSQKIILNGVIDSLPMPKQPHRLQFDFKTKQFGILNCSWYGLYPRRATPGTHWEVQAKIQPWRAVRVTTDFDYRKYLLVHGYSGSCSIENSWHTRYLGFDFWNDPLDSVRSDLRDLLIPEIENLSYQKVMLALILGDRSQITQDDWSILRNTGTNHLVAIAGLHIGLMSLVGLWICWNLLIISKRLCEVSIVPNISLGVSWLVALIYSALAGFLIPTQRALVMISVFIFSRLFGYKFNPYFSLGLAAVLIIFLNPFSVFDAGTWLSFIAVFFLIYGYQQYRPENVFLKLFYPQWVISIGLLPISVYWFSQFSLVSCLINFLVIPYVFFLVLPLLFFSLPFLFLPNFFQGLIQEIFKLDNFLIKFLWDFLSWGSGLAYSHIDLKSPSVFSVMISSLGAMILLTPSWRWWRLLGVVLMLVIFI